MEDITLYADYRQKQEPRQLVFNWAHAYGWYLRDWLPPDKETRILEIACGEGNLLAALKELGYTNAIGVELRPEAVALCQARGLSVENADALEYLNSTIENFGVILAIDFLEHLSRDRILRLLKLAKAKLASSGALIVQVPNLASPFGGAVFWGDVTHQTGFTPASLAQFGRMSGFETCTVRNAGPGRWSFRSNIRLLCWQILKISTKFWNLVETGNSGSDVITRVMLGRFK